MKFLLIATMILLPLALELPAHANTQTNPAPDEPVQTEAHQLTTEEVGMEDQQMGQGRNEQLNDSENQINQTAEQTQHSRMSLRELLNLPRGMVIRGTKRGGLAIGTEL